MATLWRILRINPLSQITYIKMEKMPSSRPAIWSMVTICAAVGSMAGCGEKPTNETPVYPVQGCLLVDGMPAAGAKIALHRADTTDDRGHFPRATVDKDGTFRLSTFVHEDGAPAGEYIVTVRWPDPKVVVRDPYGESEEVPPDLLNGRFATPRASNLRITVPKQPTRLALFDLASKEVRGASEYQLVAETN